MKTIADALAIRRRVFGAFELAETASDPDEQRRWLTFAVVGAGPTGVELAGQIRELATKTLRAEFRRIRPEDARVLLFDGGNAPLASFGPALSAKAAAALRDLGVELHLGSIVTGVDGAGLEVRDRRGRRPVTRRGPCSGRPESRRPPWPTALAKATGAEQDRAGRIQVEPDLTIPGHPEISVVGDLMSLASLPGVAEVAMQSGLYAGPPDPAPDRRRKKTAPFRYYDLGSAAYLSRGNAVVSAGPLQVRRVRGLADLAVHPHRLPHRVPQPRRRGADLGRRLRPRRPAGTDVHHPADRAAARRLRLTTGEGRSGGSAVTGERPRRWRPQRHDRPRPAAAAARPRDPRFRRAERRDRGGHSAAGDRPGRAARRDDRRGVPRRRRTPRACRTSGRTGRRRTGQGGPGLGRGGRRPPRRGVRRRAAARRPARPCPAAGAAPPPAPSTGQLATLASRGVDGLDGYVSRYLPQLLVGAVVPLVVGIRILTADWVSALLVGITVPLIPLFMVLIGLHTKARTARQWRALAVLGHHFLDVVAGLDVLTAYGRARRQGRQIEAMSQQYRLETMRGLRVAFLSSLVLESRRPRCRWRWSRCRWGCGWWRGSWTWQPACW